MAEFTQRQGRDQGCNPHRIKKAPSIGKEFFLDMPLKSRFISCVPIELNREGEANGESIEAQRNYLDYLVACDLFLSL